MSIPGVTSPARQAPDQTATDTLTAVPATPDRESPGVVEPAGELWLPTLYGCAIGRALATVRVRSGMPVWTLAVLLDRSPADVLDMEDGRAAVSLAVLELWCDLLGVRVPSVLGWAVQVAAPHVRGWVIDLRAAAELPARSGHPHVRKLAVWAGHLRRDGAHSPFLAVPEPEIRSLADRWSVPVGELIELLADLTPVALVPWHESEQDRVQGGAVQAWSARPRRHRPPVHHPNAPARPEPDQQQHQHDDADVGRSESGAPVRYPLAARVGLLLRRERLARERDLASLARALHVSISHICRVELARSEVKLSFLAWWCAELGVRLSDILRMAEEGVSCTPAVLAPPVVPAPATPGDLVVPRWTVPLYRSSVLTPRPGRTDGRCTHPEIQTRVERHAGQPADVTRCVACGQPVPIPATPNPARGAGSCPIPPDVVVLDDGVIAR